tara:strand:+ start:5313 stop:6134 length:822 start_codon:yes stop_codon:yes gene_type:complete
MIKKIESLFLNVYLNIRSLLIVLFFSKKSKINLSNSSNACILLNGPSLLNDLKKNKLRGEIYVSNDFALTDEFRIIKPNNYVLVDPFFFNNNKRSKNIFNSIFNAEWNINLYLPVKYKPLFNKRINKNYIKIYYFNHYEISGNSALTHKIFNFRLGMPKCQNVLIAILMICIWKNHSLINLYGSDHNWIHYLTLDKKNNLCLSNHRFFDISKEKKIKPWLDQHGNNYKMDEILSKLSLMFKGYNEIAYYSKIKKIKIINKTKNSLIDAFKKNI